MNAYAFLIQQRYENSRTSFMSVSVIPTYYIQLIVGGSLSESDSNSWFDNLDNNPAFLDSELILIPVNLRSSHWVAAAISTGDRYIKFFDSLQRNNDNKMQLNGFAQKIHSFLYSYGQHRQKDLKEYQKWTISYEENIPQQENENDCGVYALLFIEYLS